MTVVEGSDKAPKHGTAKEPAEAAASAVAEVDESALQQIEAEHPQGISSAAILEFFADQGIRFSEATLRKWVQLRLLPRSVRVGRKGKHQGSRGLYPVRVIRQIVRIKEMMARGWTIEEIQQQVLFVRGDIEELVQTLEKIFTVLERVANERDDGAVGARALSADLNKVRTLARELVDRIEGMERRLSGQSSARPSEEVAS